MKQHSPQKTFWTKRFPSRQLITILLSLILVLACLFAFDVKRIAVMVSGVPVAALLVAGSLLLLNLVLSCVRYHVLLFDFGVRQSLRTSFRTNIYSLVGGWVFFNFFGQGLSRAALLSKESWSPAMAFVITGMERIVSLILLLVMAIAGAAWIFRDMELGLGFDKASTVLLLVIFSCLTTAFVYLAGLRRRQREALKYIVKINPAPVVRVTAITLAMHATMMMAYAAIALQVAPSLSLADLFAITTIVMLAASLPISFSGWGVRELGAGYAFSVVGQSSNAGVAMAAAIGLLSLLILAVLAIGVSMSDSGAASVRPVARISDSRFSPILIRLFSWAAPLAAAVLVLFQVPLPTESGAVNVNLADPVAITAGLVSLLIGFNSSRWKNLWCIPGVNSAIVIMTIAMVGAFFHGWATYGLIHWALYNRLTGWFILVCYMLTGALIVQVVGRQGLKSLFRVYLVSCAAIVLTELTLRLWGSFAGLDFLIRPFDGFTGMAGNPNAFAFQLTLAAAIGFASRRLFYGRHGDILKMTLVGLLLAGIWFTASRSGIGALVLIILAYAAIRRIHLRDLAMYFVMASLILGLSYLSAWLTDTTLVSAWGRFGGHANLGHMQSDRLLSVVQGLEMWKGHLLFGAGLGAFVLTETPANAPPLVIHSSYLWLLAEFGLVGFMAFLLLPTRIIHSVWSERTWSNDWIVVAMIGFLVVMASTSVMHDMVYQRAFWLLVGATLARPDVLSSATRSRGAIKRASGESRRDPLLAAS